MSALVPPLRERTEDIRELAIHFLQKYALKHARPIVKIDEAVIERFKLYPWPGNVRELENVIERAAIVCRGDALTLDHIEIGIRGSGDTERRPPGATDGRPPVADGDGSHKDRMAEVERDQLIRAIEKTRGNKAEAARILGLDRAALRRRLGKHGLTGSEKP